MFAGLATVPTYPSWGYMPANDATTLWEQCNGYYSHIHSCFASPGGWFYQSLAGIQPDPAAPGFKRIIIKPALVGDVTWVKRIMIRSTSASSATGGATQASRRWK